MEEMPVDRQLLLDTIASNVRRLRMERKWSQDDLAVKCGVSRITINRIEMGRCMPDPELLFSLADAFGVSVDVFRQVCKPSGIAV